MKDNNTSPLNQFLNELERMILRQENAIEYIQREQKEKQYIEDLLDVLNTSKIGFVIELFSSEEAKQEEFKQMIKKVISNDNEYHQVLNEIINLYYLQKTGLINIEEVTPQIQKALEALSIIIDKGTIFLDTLNIDEDDKKLKELYQTMEKLTDLAMNFNENGLVSEIEDLDFFEELLFKMNLNNKTRLDITSYIFNRSNELSQKKPSVKSNHNAYRELENFYEETEVENTEEFLDEILETVKASSRFS